MNDLTADEERALLALDQETIDAIGLAHSGHVTPAEGETFDPGEGDHSQYVAVPSVRPPDHMRSEERPAHDCPDCTHVDVIESEWWDMPDGTRLGRARQNDGQWSAWDTWWLEMTVDSGEGKP